jgi:hypothetical protein
MWKNISILARLADSVRAVRFCRLRIARDAPTSYAISKADWQTHRNEAPLYRVSGLEVYKNVLVPESFMKFMFSTVYRVTQKDFYAHVYTFELLCALLKT